MAQTAQALINTAAANGYAKLSRRSLHDCLLAAAQATVAPDAQSLITKAAAEGDFGLSERGLSECLLAAIQ